MSRTYTPSLPHHVIPQVSRTPPPTHVIPPPPPLLICSLSRSQLTSMVPRMAALLAQFGAARVATFTGATHDQKSNTAPGFQGSRVPGFQGFRVSGFQGFRVSGFQGSRVSGFQGSRVSGFQGFRVSGFQGFRVPRLQGSRAAGLQGPRAPGLQGSRVPAGTGLCCWGVGDRGGHKEEEGQRGGSRVEGQTRLLLPACTEASLGGKE